jgi:hypothetical protein
MQNVPWENGKQYRNLFKDEGNHPMSKARILADLISDSQITASEITGLELNAIQQGDTVVEVSDTGSGGKVVVRVDGADNAEFNAGGLKIPSGTTAQRDPAAVVGSLRYNTTTGFFETFTSSGWGAVATPPSIISITPSNFDGAAGATFTVGGAFFDADTTAIFKGADGTEYAAATVTFVNSTQITLTNATNLPVSNEPFKVRVTNGAGLFVESTQGIDAGSVPAFTTAAGNIATTTRWDDAVSVTVAATDAENTISGYAITQGNLPAGLTLDGTTGAITGTSTEQTTTTYTFTIEATDSAGNTNTRQFNIQIVNAAPVWSSPAEGATEDLVLNSSGSITLSATDPEGEAVSYTSGTLPTGLSLSGNVISGTPTVEATTSVAVTASDGFSTNVRNFSINVFVPLTISTAYSQGVSGIQDIVIDGVTRTLNFQTYNNKGWVEVMFLANVADGLQTTTAFYNQPASDYLLKEANVVNGGLDYTSEHSFVALGSGFSGTDILFTSKSSKTSSSITSTGYSENLSLPLVASSDLHSYIGSSEINAVKSRLTGYFTGSTVGFSSFNNATSDPSTHQFSTSWSKGGFEFGILLHSRGGTPQTDHWMIASGASGATSTYSPNIGFRGTSSSDSYYGKNVGSWSDGTTHKATASRISSTNVFSVWITDM